MTRRKTDVLGTIERDAYLARRTRADYRATRRGGITALASRVARRKFHGRLLGALRRRGL